MSNKKIITNLFWVTDCYGGLENWFVFANDEENAERFFEDYEGMEEGDATANLVAKKCSIEIDEEEDERLYFSPETIENFYEDSDEDSDLTKEDADEIYYARHAQIEDLETLYFTIVDDGKVSNVRKVSFDKTLYTEGAMESVIQTKMQKMIVNTIENLPLDIQKFLSDGVDKNYFYPITSENYGVGLRIHFISDLESVAATEGIKAKSLKNRISRHLGNNNFIYITDLDSYFYSPISDEIKQLLS